MSASTPNTEADKVVHVAVGVVEDDRGRVLITRRSDHAHQGGLWEFPGGKVEADETVQQALGRELREELGIEPEALAPLIRIPHDYGDKRVLLDVWRVQAFAGTPAALEGQPMIWVAPSELHDYAFPAANHPISNALVLPERYLITPAPVDAASFLSALEQRLQEGHRLIQFRAHDLDDAAYEAVAAPAVELARAAGAQLLLNADPRLAWKLGVGVHLHHHRLMALAARPLPKGYPVAASCHGSEELAHALRIDVDFVVLGPVSPTRSHPGEEGMGLERFARLVRDYPRPVYALGGMTEEDLPAVRDVRGQGIAAISAFWASL